MLIHAIDKFIGGYLYRLLGNIAAIGRVAICHKKWKKSGMYVTRQKSHPAVEVISILQCAMRMSLTSGQLGTKYYDEDICSFFYRRLRLTISDFINDATHVAYADPCQTLIILREQSVVNIDVPPSVPSR